MSLLLKFQTVWLVDMKNYVSFSFLRDEPINN